MSRRVLTWVLVAWGLWLIAAPAFAHDTVYYYISDSLHSEVMVTDQNRNVVEQTDYAPYGQVMNRSLRDGPGYTGHEEDPVTGLVYMQQRYYDPRSRRFISTDPVLPTTGNFNRYRYAKDNPYTFTDPDGECPNSSSDTKPCPPPPPKPQQKPVTLPTITVTAQAIPMPYDAPGPMDLPDIPLIGILANPIVPVFLGGILMPGNPGLCHSVWMTLRPASVTRVRRVTSAAQARP